MDAPTPPPLPRIEPGQTVIFVGDQTSPDDPGYVAIISSVLARFRSDFGVNLISAGAPGQTAAGLRSRRMLEVLSSSRPDWLVAGLGRTEAMREPAAARLVDLARQREAAREEDDEDTFGTGDGDGRTPQRSGGVPDPPPPAVELLEDFVGDLGAAVSALAVAGVKTALFTIPLAGTGDPLQPLFRQYSRGIRSVGEAAGAVIVDLERATAALIDRAANYKQRVSLAGERARLNSQGQSLIARTFLETFELLPGAGFRR